MRRVTEFHNMLSLCTVERVPDCLAADSLDGLSANRLRLTEDGVFRLAKPVNLLLCA